MQECLQERRARGLFRDARIGRDATLQRKSEVRGDQTCWLSEPSFGAERELLRGLERLRMRLNRDLTLGLFELELHYAYYPPGAGYARHVDQPQASIPRPATWPAARRVSLVLYLNENWHAADGGELELYDGAKLARRVEPLAGRLVCFLTEGREHAVLTAHRERFSISGWYRSR